MRLPVFLLLAAGLHAGPWKGQVYERGGAGPVSGAVLMDLSGTVLAETGKDGAFELLSPPAQVRVSADGYDSKVFKPGRPKIYLLKIAFESDELLIVGTRDRVLSSSRIEASQVRRIAGAGGDALRAIKTMPGVAVLSDFSGQLSVRGGAPEDNKYFLDGIPWPVPYHFGGILTTVNADLLDSVQLLSGGFPARWGNMTGAIIEATTRPGKAKPAASIDINLVTSNFVVEGPLGLSPSSKATWTFSGRRSYFDLILPYVIDLSDTALPYFWDLGGTLNFELGPKSRLRLLLMGTDDVLALTLKKQDLHSSDFAGELKYHNKYLSSGLALDDESGPLKTRTALYYYDVGFESSFGSGYRINSEPRVGGFKEEAELALGDHKVGLGGGVEDVRQELSGYTFVRTRTVSPGFFWLTTPKNFDIHAEVWLGNAYLQDTWSLLPSLRLTPGLRYDKGYRAVEALTPRASLEWEPVKGSIARLAWGRYAQSPTARQLSPSIGNPELSMIDGTHYVAGLEQSLGTSIFVRLEGYLKTWRSLVVEVPDDRIYTNSGEGRASGVEAFLNYDDKSRFFGWISAAWGHSERRADSSALWRYYEYDQPWNVTLVGNGHLTPRIDFGATLAWHSGNLITPIVGGVHNPVDDSWSPIYGDPLSQRMPDYLRLDAKLEYKWIFETWRLSAYLEVLNLTNSLNALDRNYSRDYSSAKDVGQIPRLPYFGFTAAF